MNFHWLIDLEIRGKFFCVFLDKTQIIYIKIDWLTWVTKKTWVFSTSRLTLDWVWCGASSWHLDSLTIWDSERPRPQCLSWEIRSPLSWLPTQVTLSKILRVPIIIVNQSWELFMCFSSRDSLKTKDVFLLSEELFSSSVHC